MPVAFSSLTWCLWSCLEPEQSWAFPKRLGLFQGGLITIYYISKNYQKAQQQWDRKRKETYQALGTTPRGRAALQVPLLSRDLVTDWAHPGGSRHISVIVYALLELLFMETLKFSPFCHFCLSKYYPEISRQTCFLKCLHWTESVWIFIS